MDLAESDWYEMGRRGYIEPCILHEGLPLIEVEIHPLILRLEEEVNRDQIFSFG